MKKTICSIPRRCTNPQRSSKLPQPHQSCRCLSRNSGIARGLRIESKQPESQEGHTPGRRRIIDAYDALDPIQSFHQSLPYTKAASTFIYGLDAIDDAIDGKNREIYNIYIKEFADGLGEKRIMKTADTLGISCTRVAHSWLGRIRRTLEKNLKSFEEPMSESNLMRLRNASMVAEVSQISVPPIKSLGEVKKSRERFEVEPDRPQSAEDAEIHRVKSYYTYQNRGWRHPLVLWVHEATNTTNLGSMIRSALYFGVDAVVLSRRATVGVNSGAASVYTTSVGTVEYTRFFSIDDPEDFMKRSQEAGWKFLSSVKHGESWYAGISRESELRPESKVRAPLYNTARMDGSPLVKDPCVLIVGNEKSGLPLNVKQLADAGITIGAPRGLARESGLDSLNVGVAAAIMFNQLLGKYQLEPGLAKQTRSRKPEIEKRATLDGHGYLGRRRERKFRQTLS